MVTESVLNHQVFGGLEEISCRMIPASIGAEKTRKKNLRGFP